MSRFGRMVVLFMILSDFSGLAAASSPSLSRVAGAIKFYLKARSPGDEKIEVTITSSIELIPKQLPDQLNVSSRKRGEISGRTLFFIKYQDRMKMWKSFMVVAEVERLSQVLVLKETLQRNQIITEEVLAPSLRPARWPKRERPVEKEEALGKRSARMLLKGRILFASMLEEVPVIERGQPATLIVYSKNMSVSMPVVACQNAGLGEEIKVKSKSTEKYYQAIVEDSDTVVLRY